ncbi:MAG: glycosyltransferase family 39 protein [Gammaproteobacteria bacterium]|nr:glycosyltransferase family 39 protein [Gammaproteobacteria bacterium]
MAISPERIIRNNEYSLIGFRLFLLFLLSTSIAGVLFYINPGNWLDGWLILISPDRTTRAIDPSYIRITALIVSLCSFSLGILFLVRPALFRSSIATPAKQFLCIGKSIPDSLLQFAKETPRSTLFGLSAVLVIGAILRVHIVVTRTIGPDEAINFVYFASRTIFDILSDYHIPNNHVFHTLLAHISYYSFGESLAAFRLPAMVAGFLLIPVVFWLAKRLFDTETALITSGLMAVIPPMLEFSGDARGYTLVTLFLLIAFVMATYLQEKFSYLLWSIFIVSISLGIFTIPIAVYGAFMISAWLLLGARKCRLGNLLKELAVASMAVMLISAVLYSPIIIRSGLTALFIHSQTKALPLLELIGRLPQLVTDIRSCWAAPQEFFAGSALIAGFTLALILPGEKRNLAWQLTVAMLFSVAPLILLQRIIPSMRFINYLVPVFIMIVAYGYRSLLFSHIRMRFVASPLFISTIVIAVCLAWALGMKNVTRYSCIENGFRDAEAMANDFAPLLRETDIMVAYLHSGIAESTRYHLMTIGVSPRRLYTYVPWKSLNQLQQYRRLYALVKDCENGLLELGISKNESSVEFLAPRLLRRYSESCVYLVERRQHIGLKAPPESDDPFGFPRLW